MESGVANPVLASAIVSTANGLDAINASGMSPANARDAIVCIREFEVLRRRMDAVQVGLLSAIDEACFYGADGHASAKAMLRHYAKLSSGEAAAQDKTRKVLTAMPEVAVAYWAGDIGVDQIRVMGRIYANPRVRNKMRDDQSWFVNRAKRLDYETFTAKAINWARLADDDGPDPKAERTHERRDTKFSQDFDTSWTLIGGFAAGQGASMYEIFEHYVEAETLADWEKARAEHGDLATYTDLPRSIQQRRADALWQLFHDAAASPHGAMPPSYVHNIVWDHTTFEEMARRVETGEIEPLDPDIFRCETIDGIGLDPYETFANAMNSRIRRVLIDAKGVVLDQGEARFFTGLARHAVKLQFHECVWIGCHIPTSRCEADHIHEHSRHGRTHPGNGAPLCGKHNRWKQKGFTVHRDQTGHWHIYRPDGTEIPTH